VDLNSIELFQTAHKRMKWLASRQQVISENIANSDTPGYLAKEVDDFDRYMDNARTTGIRTTNPKHISGGRVGEIGTRVDDEAWEVSPNGNSVSVEQQSIKAAEVSNQYGMVTNLYKKSLNLLAIASSGGK
jgi:flagellar basal-body rod protein FlgB